MDVVNSESDQKLEDSIDEEYDEVVVDKFACIEFRFVGGNWYILSSDGLKQS